MLLRLSVRLFRASLAAHTCMHAHQDFLHELSLFSGLCCFVIPYAIVFILVSEGYVTTVLFIRYCFRGLFVCSMFFQLSIRAVSHRNLSLPTITWCALLAYAVIGVGTEFNPPCPDFAPVRSARPRHDRTTNYLTTDTQPAPCCRAQRSPLISTLCPTRKSLSRRFMSRNAYSRPSS